jgi:hypothetical protein
MVTRAEVVATSRRYLDCKYHHQGRICAGIDCIGLAIAVCRDLGLGDHDFQNYSREPDGVTLMTEIEKVCTPITDYALGDLLVFRLRHLPQHCGIVTDLPDGLGLIHAYQTIGKVAEHALTDWWIERIVAAYRLPGIET